jgi:hypothetical protein
LTTDHDVDLFLDLCKRSLVGNSDALEDMVGSIEHRLGCPNKIDMGEAT